MNRIFGRIATMGMLVLGVGCGGTELEDVQSQELAVVDQAAAQAEEPRKIEDLLGGLDRKEGVLHVRDDSQGIVLRELQAQPVGEGVYMTKDAMTGEPTQFVLKIYPFGSWFNFWKLCPNGQRVLKWMTCPDLIVNDPLTRVWQNSSCSWKVQSASVGVCTNAGGGSYRYQYLEAWKCGLGTGYCVERRAAKAIRYDYSLAACDPALVSNVQSTNYDFLCKP